jgi:DNA ligase (NAD+)
MNKTPIKIPTNCPTCNGLLVKNGPFLECSNTNCSEIKVHQITKWIGKMEIMHLSTKTLEKLMSAGLVTCIADLYSLTLDKVQGIDGIGQGFQRIIDEINRSRNPDLPKFLAGFDMDGIGERIWRPICETLNLATIADCFNIKANELLKVPGIAETRAILIMENLTNMAEELLKTEKIVGISSTVKSVPIQGNLTGKSFCFTGALITMKRAEAESLVTSKGGTIGSVNKNLTYLVTNDADSGSSKNVKAQSLGITLIDEKQFLEMVK